MKRSKKVPWKMLIIIIEVMAAVVLLGVVSVQSFRNKAISLEEAVYTAQSDIKVQEKRRVDLVYNLAYCVKRYDQHESDTLKDLAESMSKGNNAENVSTAISAIGYSFPKLESDSNYKKLMNELATTENLMAQYRENYNQSVNTYSRYVKKFPARIFLDMTGYDVQDFERLDFEAPEDAPQNLFGE